MHAASPNKKQNHLQNSFLQRTQFWVRKTFSKPALLKRASLVWFFSPSRSKARSCQSASLVWCRPDVDDTRTLITKWSDEFGLRSESVSIQLITDAEIAEGNLVVGCDSRFTFEVRKAAPQVMSPRDTRSAL